MQERTIPVVSVVMPAYNAEKYLREAIDSILAQTFADFEFIIVNDGSSDRTKEIIQSYADPRIVYIENERNLGICVTLNKGIDSAVGQYVVRMDSDDIAVPERLAVQVAYMNTHPAIGASGCDMEVFGDGIESHVFEQLHTPEDCAAGLLFNTCFAHPSVIMRRSVLEEHDLRYKNEFRGLEDFELWWQIAKHSRVNNIARPLIKYRHHKEQVTQNVSLQTKKAFEEFTRIRFADLGIDMSDKDLYYLNAYACNDLEKFGMPEIREFIGLCHRIYQEYPAREAGMRTAVRLTLGKSVAYIVSNSSRLVSMRQRYYNKALLAGVFSPLWFAKVTFHNMLRILR